MYSAPLAIASSAVLVPSVSAEVEVRHGGHFADVTAVSEAPLWYFRAVRIVNDFRDLEANWDSYQSPPPTEVARASALRVLRFVPEVALGAPHIAPVSGGGIDLGWYFDRSRLEVEVLPDGSIEYLFQDPDGRIDDGSIAAGHVSSIREQLRWAAT
jgi:hypothetical protein